MSGRAAFVESVHEHTRHKIRQQQPVMRGTITKLKPLTVDPFGSTLDITQDDDMDLTAWMTLYQHVVGFQTGDHVLLLRDNDSWVMFDVVADSNVLTKFKKAGVS